MQFCHECNERIYPAEQQVVEGSNTYHKFCYRRKTKEALLKALLRTRAKHLGVRVLRNPPSPP